MKGKFNYVVFQEHFTAFETQDLLGVRLLGVFPGTPAGWISAINFATDSTKSYADKFGVKIKHHDNSGYEYRTWCDHFTGTLNPLMESLIWVVKKVPYAPKVKA